VALIALPIEPATAADRAPRVSATSAILLDARDGHVLYRRRAGTGARSPRDEADDRAGRDRRVPLDRRVRACACDAAECASTCAWERMAVSDLMRALLLETNDAAATRGARPVEDAFVAQMNERRARSASPGRASNPIGLDSPGNHSSAQDLARIARAVLANDFLAATADMPRARLTTGARTRVIANRNRLVARVPYVDGVKTGQPDAGYVLVGAAARKGARLVSVVPARPRRARACRHLALRYGFSLYRRVSSCPRRDARARRSHWRQGGAAVAGRRSR
jgi:D-alanyl-D-alanine carboxypeptidase